MDFREYACLRGYDVFETTDAVVKELTAIGDFCDTINARLSKEHPDWDEKKVLQRVDLGLMVSRDWFSLSIFGLDVSAAFTVLVMYPLLKTLEARGVPDWLRLGMVLFCHIVWISTASFDRPYVAEVFKRDQQERCALLLSALLEKNELDDRIFQMTPKDMMNDPNVIQKILADFLLTMQLFETPPSGPSH